MQIIRTCFIVLISISLVGCTFPGSPKPPTDNPSIHPSSTFSLTQTISPPPTPSLTPTPEIQVLDGDQALFNGDFNSARQDYLIALARTTDNQIKASALWGLAKVEYQAKYFDQSLVYLEDIISNYKSSNEFSKAFFLQAQCYDALKRYNDAATSYSNYSTINPNIIDSYIHEFRGDSLTNSGDHAGALSAYLVAFQAPRVGDKYSLKIKIASMYSSIGDITSSLAIYNDLASATSESWVKAQMDFLIGQSYLISGQPELAYPYFLDTVNNYPTAYDSYPALIALVEAGIEVDDLNRGLVDYVAGQYGVALDAFNRYLVSHPEHDGTVLYYLGLTMRENGEYQLAIDYWSQLINNYPGNLYWESAWTDRAKVLWSNLDNYQEAAQSLLDYVKAYPNNSNAPSNLNYAARIQDWDNQLEAAAETWQRLAIEYPGNELVIDALFNAGIELYRLADYEKALVVFQKDLIFSSLPADQARAYLWIGKTQQSLSDMNGASQSFQLAAGLDPTGYYSERSRDLLLGRALFDAPIQYDLNYDITNERSEAEAWIRVTFNLPPDTDLNGEGSLSSDLRFIRGTELWVLGLFDLARIEFEDLRIAVAENPADSYRLLNYMIELGFYRIAIESSRQLLLLAGMETYTQMLAAPQYFNHINYGVYFQDLIVPIAQEFELQPFLIFSVITQESSFESFIHSSAGAMGLMQIIPSTGEERAMALGWPINFTQDDLYRPNVSIRLGASYLRKNLYDFNGDYFAALSAYNAGPGNALFWKDLSGDDPDLYLEIVRFTNSDPYDYIWKIYEIFTVYRSIYGSNQ